jgi:hypothetical protein
MQSFDILVFLYQFQFVIHVLISQLNQVFRQLLNILHNEFRLLCYCIITRGRSFIHFVYYDCVMMVGDF